MRSYWVVWADTGQSPGRWYAHESQIPVESGQANHLKLYIRRPKKQDWVNSANQLRDLFASTGVDIVGQVFAYRFYIQGTTKPTTGN